MIPRDATAPFLPWLVVAASVLAGVLLSYGLRWFSELAERKKWRGGTLVASFRGAVVLYAGAVGITLAPFDFAGQPKREVQSDRIVVSLLIIATTMVASRLAARFINLLGRQHGDRFPSATLFATVAQITAVVLGALVLLQSLNIAIAPILTALGVGGLAVALALRDTLANLFSGIQIVAARQVRPGDYIKLEGGSEGYVTDITWRSTTIRELGNNLIVVPNEKLASAIFTNYSRPEQRTVVSADVLVAYGYDLARVEGLAVDVARSVAKELSAPEEDPYVRFRQLTDPGITVTTFFAVARFADQYAARSLFNQRFYARCEAEGILIPRQPWAERPPEKRPVEKPTDLA